MRSLSDQSLVANGSFKAPVDIYLSLELHKVFRVLWSAQWPAARPYGLLRALWKFAPQFASSQQQDASEFFSIIRDGIHAELLSLLSPSTLSPRKDRSSIVTTCFEGSLKTTVTCSNCSCESHTTSPFMELTLTIPMGPNGEHLAHATLDECLELFETPELVDYRCEKCKVQSSCTKRVGLASLPKVLVICLKRFTFSRLGRPFKVKTAVSFPLRNAILDLSGFCPDSKHTCYQLRSVISHHGRGIDQGHYTTTSYNDQRSQWLLYDDHKVRPLSFKESPDQIGSPYLLFYESSTIATDL